MNRHTISKNNKTKGTPTASNSITIASSFVKIDQLIKQVERGCAQTQTSWRSHKLTSFSQKSRMEWVVSSAGMSTLVVLAPAKRH
jgi:hypothetical protein